MSNREFPVTVAVTRPNGQIEHVRVGTAIQSDDGFSLRLGELSIGSTPVSSGLRTSAPPPPMGGGDGLVFPPYGRSKGMPIAGATMQDLEFYAGGSRRSLGDPAKARWHDKERVLLAAIEAEMARQQGGGGAPSSEGRGVFRDDEPPPSDDDIPF